MKPRVIFVTGATATGKSAWALEVAREVDAHIINCDSIQAYEGLEIGSCQPSPQEKSIVSHHLYGYVPPGQELSAGRYQQDFLRLMSSLPNDARILVVGGTGFYFQAIEKGMHDVPVVPAELKAQLAAQAKDPAGFLELRRELEAGDPATAQRLPAADLYRLTRAIELLRMGVVPSQQKARFQPEPFPYPLLKTGLLRERDELRRRIRQRTEQMIRQGLVAETREALERAGPDWAPLSAVGYKEACRFLQGSESREWLFDEICLRTAQLAKRQMTWFKRDTEMRSFRGDGDRTAFRDACLRFFTEKEKVTS